ncbi:hypothetical protein G6N74_07805 [Mesorhizobium sp. CGMCC 1.15528]|uniref:Transmembrane protein n=1 Tax=Mesorhizobium zhangyense TaxID=1776730 RepID=A0A7C9V548_9HYPH|nr:hypothetical protein [Mesorhizobium zhangyense]NGN40965.1 hypothetical protein [Mesorhizobium zhangyense]
MPLHRLHAAAGILAFILIASFWLSTAISELFGTPAAIASVKQAIVWAMLVLVPALAATGATGFRLDKGMRLPMVAAKKKRMPFIALNGMLVLLPSALFLNAEAAAGDFGTAFMTVQAIELAAGLINLTMMGFNIRDGLALSARRQTLPAVQ